VSGRGPRPCTSYDVFACVRALGRSISGRGVCHVPAGRGLPLDIQKALVEKKERNPFIILANDKHKSSIESWRQKMRLSNGFFPSVI